MSAQYHFMSNWTIQAPLDRAEQVLMDQSSWTQWWAGLESAEVTGRTDRVVGTTVKCIWRSATGYKLHLTITLTAYEMGKRFAFESTGDLVGSGTWELSAKGSDTHMTITWDVHTTKTWMNALSWLLRPVFILNHHSLMRRGEAGLNRYLRTS